MKLSTRSILNKLFGKAKAANIMDKMRPIVAKVMEAEQELLVSIGTMYTAAEPALKAEITAILQQLTGIVFAKLPTVQALLDLVANEERHIIEQFHNEIAAKLGEK